MTDKPAIMTHAEVHAILDEARFGDTLTVVRTNGDGLTSTVSGPVLWDSFPSPSVVIDLFDGDPYIVRDYGGDIWGEFLRVELTKGEPR